jgi:hypothetical protein
LDGVVLDLSKEHPTVTTPPNHPLLTNVRLNPILSDNVFGKFNSLFVNPKRAGGMMTVLVERCENLPIDEVLTNPAAGGRNAPRGSAQFNVSMENLDLANNFVNTMMALFKRDLRADRLQGNIRDARIGIANGVVTQDLTVYLDRYPLQFKGGVNLTTSQYSNMSLIFPPELLSHFDEGMLKYLPKGIPVPLRGNVSSPQVAVDEVAPRLAAEAGAKMLLDRNTRRSPQDEQGTKKDEKKSDDPVGDLIDILGGNRNKDRNR